MGSLIAASSQRAMARPRGFTLVEILVVLLILALAGGAAALALAPDERGAALREARRFAGALEYAAARAQSRGETLGVSAAGNSVRFWRRDPLDARWHALDEDVLAAHALPAPLVAAAVAYAGQRVPANAILPLKPSGRNEPFQFVVASQAWRVTLVADPLNRVTLDGPVPLSP